MTDLSSRVIESRIANCWSAEPVARHEPIALVLVLVVPEADRARAGSSAVAPAAPAAAPMNVLRSSLRCFAMCVRSSPLRGGWRGRRARGAPEASTG